MKGSFDILLPSSWSITGESDKYLHHLQHPFPHAAVRIWADDGSFLFEQIYIGISISVYSYEIHLARAGQAIINIHQGHLNGLYLVEGTGQMLFHPQTDTVKQIRLHKDKACYAYVTPGRYSASIDAGIHVLWGFVIHPPLVALFKLPSYQHLYDLVYKQDDTFHTSLQVSPYFTTDDSILRFLKYLIDSISQDPLLTKEYISKGIRILISFSKDILFDEYERIRSDIYIALKAKKHIESLIDAKGSDFKIKDVAVDLDVSHEHLSRVFLKTYHITLQDFFDQTLISKIKDYLLLVENVSDTAYEFRFNHSNNLSRYFKKHTGLTPSEYIKRNKMK